MWALAANGSILDTLIHCPFDHEFRTYKTGDHPNIHGAKSGETNRPSLSQSGADRTQWDFGHAKGWTAFLFGCGSALAPESAGAFPYGCKNLCRQARIRHAYHLDRTFYFSHRDG